MIVLTQFASVFTYKSQVVYFIVLLCVFSSIFIRGVVLTDDHYISPRKILSPLSIFDDEYKNDKDYYFSTIKKDL